MKVAPSFSALITGAGSGIGRALALALAHKGASISVVDFGEANGLETLGLVKQEHAKLQLQQAIPAGIFTKCDVTKPADVKAAFDSHKASFGTLDLCINCAGIGERGDVFDDDLGSWRSVIDVNLLGLIECTIRAVELMRAGGKPGLIVNVASAGGLHASPFPVYSASKGGVVLFTRSLNHLEAEGIVAKTLCPEFVETPLTKPVPKEIIDGTGGFITMDKIVEGTLKLVEGDDGDCLWISATKGFVFLPRD